MFVIRCSKCLKIIFNWFNTWCLLLVIMAVRLVVVRHWFPSQFEHGEFFCCWGLLTLINRAKIILVVSKFRPELWCYMIIHLKKDVPLVAVIGRTLSIVIAFCKLFKYDYFASRVVICANRLTQIKTSFFVNQPLKWKKDEFMTVFFGFGFHKFWKQLSFRAQGKEWHKILIVDGCEVVRAKLFRGCQPKSNSWGIKRWHLDFSHEVSLIILHLPRQFIGYERRPSHYHIRQELSTIYAKMVKSTKSQQETLHQNGTGVTFIDSVFFISVPSHK